MIKNKRGVIEVALIVVLFLALVFTTFFYFATSTSKVAVKINDAKFLDGVYAKEKIAGYYVFSVGEKAFEKSANSDRDVLRVNFVYNFKEEFSKYKFSEDYLAGLQEKIKNSDFNIFVEGNELIVRVNLELEDSIEDLKVIYTPIVEKRFALNE